MKGILFIFSHIPKCAGSTFINYIRKNLPQDAYLEIEYDTLSLPEKGAGYKDYLKNAEKYISKLTQARRDKIEIIFGHSVPYGIHKFFDRKAKYFTFFRNPSDRVVSQYNYLMTTYKREGKLAKKNALYNALLINGSVPSFEEWLDKKYSDTEWKNVNRTTFEFLNELGYLKGTTLKELKKKFFFVGLKKNFSEDSLYLCSLLGFNKFFINENVSKKYVRYKEEERIYSLAPKKFEKNVKLFNNAQKYNSELRAKEEYKKAVSRMKIKRLFYLPFTQTIYGFDDLVRELKNKIKDNLPR